MLQEQHGQTSPHPAARRTQVIASVQLKANSQTNNKQSTMFMLPMHEDFCRLLETAAGPSCRFDSMLHLWSVTRPAEWESFKMFQICAPALCCWLSAQLLAWLHYGRTTTWYLQNVTNDQLNFKKSCSLRKCLVGSHGTSLPSSLHQRVC